MKLVVTRNSRIYGKTVLAGTIIETSDERAEALLQHKRIEKFDPNIESHKAALANTQKGGK